MEGSLKGGTMKVVWIFLAVVWIVLGLLNAKMALPKLYGSGMAGNPIATFWFAVMGPAGFLFSAGNFWIGRTIERIVQTFLQ